MESEYTIITVDCGIMGRYHYLYKDGKLVDEQDGQPDDGWYDIHWPTVLKVLKIPYEKKVINDEGLTLEDSLPRQLEEWDARID